MGLATAISLGLAIVGTGLSVNQAIKGAQAKSEADEGAAKAASDIARINEANKYASLKVPTMGLDLATQRMREWQQTQIQALKEGGATTVLGGMPGVSQQAYAQERELAAQADTMQYNRDFALAQNAQQLEANKAQREASLAGARLSGAQNASIAGQNNMNAGIQGAVSNLGNAAYSYQYFNQNRPVVDTATPPGTPINPNAAYTPPGVAAQSYPMPGATNMPTGQAPAWQSNYGQSGFRPVINSNPLTNYPGLNMQTGDPLNDMYNRNAMNQMYGNLYKYGNPRF
jgi:hypothetical protein